MFRTSAVTYLIAFSFFIGGSSFAQTSKFEGTDVHASLGYQSLSPKLTNINVPGTTGLTFPIEKSTSYPLTFGAGFTKALDDKYTLGASYDVSTKSKTSKGELYTNGAISAGDGGYTGFKNMQQFSVIPGVLTDKDTLMYGKIGYFTGKTYGTNDDNSAFNSIKETGYAFGIGGKKFIDQNTFGFAEINSLRFKNKNRTDPTNSTVTYTSGGSGYNINIGLGYKF